MLYNVIKREGERGREGRGKVEWRELGTPGKIRNYSTAEFDAVLESTGKSFWSPARAGNWTILSQQQSIGF